MPIDSDDLVEIRAKGQLGQDMLDQQQCSCGGEVCDNKVLVFASVCHPGAGLAAAYHKERKTIGLFCNECQSLVCEIAVAKETRLSKRDAAVMN